MDPSSLMDWMAMGIQAPAQPPHLLDASFQHNPNPLQQPHSQPEPVQEQSDPFQLSASQFQFFRLLENLAEAVEGGVRDQHSDYLVNELMAQFEKCQQLLNSLAGSNETSIGIERQKVEEYEKGLSHRRELIEKYKAMAERYIQSN
eukprot:TRINITY_DN424_c0_g1_i1.p1 TRINITY_DN424_c0_g1~~TRINITY_DN424_c0_g1_i1.p1  ORF type:complete len:146 (-),score=27.97 TRINITY_DN424_c0_g1_i1:295-732(-)